MRLFLVDSSIYIYKAWFGAREELLNSAREPNQAFIGFTDFVYRLLTERAPEKLVFAFDQSQQQSARKLIYPAYKLNRSATPEALRRQFSWCQQWVDHLGISTVKSDNWEADDLIGTLASLHRTPDLPIVILSADKDLTQLVHEGDIWWNFFADKQLDFRAVVKKFGVRPDQIAEQLALTGDKVDNIPGIPQIGLKTSALLLRKFGNLQALRANLTRVGEMKFRYAARVQQSLIENEAILDVSLQLTRINCAVDSMRSVGIDRIPAKLDQLTQMMEFHAMDASRQQKWLDYLAETHDHDHIQ